MKKTKTKKKAPRRPSARTYTVFLGLQFKSDQYDRSDIVATVESAIAMAQGDLQRSYPGIRLRLEHQLKPGDAINARIISMVRDAAAVVFEVSERNPNVYFELGLAYASAVSQPLLLFSKKAAKGVSIASDVRDIVRLNYPHEEVDQVVGRIARHIKRLIKTRIKQEAKGDAWADLRKIWSGAASTRQITIVCPELPPSYQPKYAKPGSPEFVNLAHFGDVDALVQVLTLLPNLFPNAEARYVTSKEMQRGDREGNLIVIGGPDFNRLTAELLEPISFPFEYCEKGRRTVIHERATGREFALKRKNRRVCHDYGLFARFPNPLNGRNAVIMIGGLQTFGVLGAVQAFSMNPAGRKNAKRVMNLCSGSPRFATLIPVAVSANQPSKSDIDTSAFHPYPW